MHCFHKVVIPDETTHFQYKFAIIYLWLGHAPLHKMLHISNNGDKPRSIGSYLKKMMFNESSKNKYTIHKIWKKQFDMFQKAWRRNKTKKYQKTSMVESEGNGNP